MGTNERAERIETLIVMGQPRWLICQQFKLLPSELEDIVGPPESEPERDSTSGY